MLRQQIISVGNSAALLLSDEMLGAMGIHVGDEVDVSVEDRKLIMKPLNEVEREQKVKSMTQVIIKRRKSAYERLADGVS